MQATVILSPAGCVIGRVVPFYKSGIPLFRADVKDAAGAFKSLSLIYYGTAEQAENAVLNNYLGEQRRGK